MDRGPATPTPAWVVPADVPPAGALGAHSGAHSGPSTPRGSPSSRGVPVTVTVGPVSPPKSLRWLLEGGGRREGKGVEGKVPRGEVRVAGAEATRSVEGGPRRPVVDPCSPILFGVSSSRPVPWSQEGGGFFFQPPSVLRIAGSSPLFLLNDQMLRFGSRTLALYELYTINDNITAQARSMN